jgi:hypothetical protein
MPTYFKDGVRVSPQEFVKAHWENAREYNGAGQVNEYTPAIYLAKRFSTPPCRNSYQAWAAAAELTWGWRRVNLRPTNEFFLMEGRWTRVEAEKPPPHKIITRSVPSEAFRAECGCGWKSELTFGMIRILGQAIGHLTEAANKVQREQVSA